MLDVIRDSANTLLTIIDDILDISKIEAGKLCLERTQVSLRDMVETTMDLVSSRAREKGLELAWAAEDGVPDIYLGDPVRLRQVVLNLLGNAIKFTERGSVTVEISELERNGGYVAVRVEVRDTGLGMTEEQCQRLFQPFSQADTSTTRRFGGTGLGLSICRRLVDMMGGSIGVNSVEGAGSTFWFEVALEQASEPAIHAADDLSGARVLVVEDLPAALRSASATLRAHGALVREARNAAEAKAALAEGVDAVLLDEIAGVGELLPHVLAAVPAGAVCPLSHRPSEQVTQWCRAHGLVDPVAKPLRRSGLLRLTGVALGRVCDLPEPKAVARMTADRVPLTAEQAETAGTLILVAEDNAINRLVIGKQLAHLGYAYEMVENGEMAWQALARRRYGLLLTDCFMPVLDGYELTGRIRDAELRADASRLPIVALTANALNYDSEKCLRAGMDDYLSKPVCIERLATVLAKWLPSQPVAAICAPAAVPAPAVDTAVVDIAGLAALLGDDSEETLRDMFDFFIETFPELLETLDAAVAARDRLAIRNAAHAAKGAARNAMATTLAGALSEIEGAAMTARFKTLESGARAAAAAFDAVTVALRRRFAAL
jgi:CheY-like chemotaxis protein/HPt (histidine-containing phosphotransfer) domain-containing protein